MNKIKIYTFSHNRPDFIELQYNSIKKHVKDDFEFIVFNNEYPGGDGGFDPNRISEIDTECNRLGIKTIHVELEPEFKILNNRVLYDNGQYVGGAAACAYSLSWAWQRHISKENCIIVVMDSDMFFCQDISIIDRMNGYNFAYCPSYRKNHEVKYPWNGIVFADIPNMPNPQEMTWGDGIVNGIPTDVGGELHHYLEKYKNELRQLYIDMWGYLVETNNFIELTVNGCAQYFMNLENKKLEIRDPRTLVYDDNLKSFPHQISRPHYWEYFLNNYSDINKIVTKYNFPKPIYLDFIKFEKDETIDTSFILHYKSASNYQAWANDDYNINKTTILKTFLKDN